MAVNTLLEDRDQADSDWLLPNIRANKSRDRIAIRMSLPYFSSMLRTLDQPNEKGCHLKLLKLTTALKLTGWKHNNRDRRLENGYRHTRYQGQSKFRN
ncbi:MAG: hypothetical protein K9N34_00640 [Candidatus Marinimicrobia bacterium]|nr:hypothetical protein [Candidatus Neomarinimicrobiota bacterium]MCF7839302.1 hypothetical protein [Candidatus Neomarinimicrobiota bacterium]